MMIWTMNHLAAVSRTALGSASPIKIKDTDSFTRLLLEALFLESDFTFDRLPGAICY